MVSIRAAVMPGRPRLMRDSSAVRWLGRVALHAFDTLFPPVCVGCGAGLDGGAVPVCSVCRLRLPALSPPYCARCGATRYGALLFARGCTECAAWSESLVRAASPYRMDGLALRLVHALKYEGWTALAPFMGRCMAHAARRLGGEPQAVLVPVPLAPSRLRERGFNQAELLAAGVSAATGWPAAALLRRRRPARQQARLGRSRRVDNVRDLFAALPGAGGWERPVLLVDDVITTGATAAACARAISAAGLEFAGVISFARAIRRIEIEDER
ncbi:MAG: ComF family protein [Gemmatimonadota bacterium]